MRAKRGGFLLFCFPSLAFAILFFQPIPLPTSSVSLQPTPLWWEIAIHLKTVGEYKLEEGNSTVVGNYTFFIRWTGSMEKDDSDYLLYPLDCQLSDWKALETSSSPEVMGILTTHDFKEKPSFKLKYILRRDSHLNLDFIVNGIFAPQNGADDVILILFPSSEENGQRDFQLDYNACVREGSNRVSLEEAAIYVGPLTKNYSWTWRHQKWQLKQERTVLTAQSHRANVSLSIIPHYARPK